MVKPTYTGPVDVITTVLSNGGAPVPDALARIVWAALVEHGETWYLEEGHSMGYGCSTKPLGMDNPRPVLVLPMPEEPNDA